MRGSRLWLLLTLALAVLVPSGTLPVSTATAQSDETISATTGDESNPLAHSASIERSRDLEVKLKLAAEHAGRGTIASCVKLLREALDENAATFVRADATGLADPGGREFGELSVSVSEAAQRLIVQLPAAVGRQFRIQSENAQRDDAAQAGDQTVAEWRSTTQRFPATRRSLDVWRRLAAQALDQGRMIEAAAAFGRVLLDPLANDRERAQAGAVLRFLEEIERTSSTGPDQTLNQERDLDQERDQAAPAPAQAPMPGRQRASVPPGGLKQLSRTPDFQFEIAVDAETRGLLDEALHEHSEQAIPVLPQFRPLIRDDVLFVRSPSRLGAYRFATGEMLWQVQPDSAARDGRSRPAMHLSLHDLVGRMIARQVQLDTVYSTLAADDQRLFVVEASDVEFGSVPREPLSPFAAVSTSPMRNRIVARDQATGTEFWSYSAASLLQDDEFEVFFTGPPTLIDDSAFGLVQVDDRVELYELDRRTGRQLQHIPLARTPRNSAADADWRSTASPVVVADGVLVCATGAGLVVGVDLVTRTPIWARRYARDDIPQPMPRLPGAGGKLIRHWWDGWRSVEVQIVPGSSSNSISESPTQSPTESPDQSATESPTQSPIGLPAKLSHATLALVTSPDSQSVFALDVQSGAVRWTLPVREPLFFEPVSANRLLVVERHFVTAVDAVSGAVVWQQAVREPVGRGVLLPQVEKTVQANTAEQKEQRFNGERFAIPVRGSRLAIVRLSDGAVDYSAGFDGSTGSVMARSGAFVIAQAIDRVSVWQMEIPSDGSLPDGSLQLVPKVATPESDDAVRRARLQSLIERAEHDPSETLLRELQREIAAGTLTREPAEQRILLHAAARLAARVDLPDESVSTYLKLLAANPVGEEAVYDAGPARIVRRDRLIQGELIAVLNDVAERSTSERSTSDVVRRVDAALGSAIEAARDSRDPFAIQRFATRTRLLPTSGELALRPEARIGQSFVESQIELQRLIGHSDLHVSDAAAEELAGLFASRQYLSDAAAIRHQSIERQRRRLSSRDAGSDSRDDKSKSSDNQPSPTDNQSGSSGNQSGSNDDSELARREADQIEILRAPNWPDGRPSTSERPGNPEASAFRPVPIECLQGSLFERLNVALLVKSQRDPARLRFYGDGNAGYWELSLPKSPSPFRSVWSLPRAWGVGHLLILRVGAELFGITPYSNSGEPRARLLWTVDMANGATFEGHRYERPIPGFAEDDLIWLDASDRPIAQVGPVLAGYACFQTKGQLVCLDPLTGQRLWQRSELPQSPQCSGDEQFVYLVERDSQHITVLNAIDGRTQRRGPLLDSGAALRAASPASSTQHRPVATNNQNASQEDASETCRAQWRVLKLTGRFALLGVLAGSRVSPASDETFERLLRIDLRTGTIIREFPVPPQSVAFALDDASFGVLDAAGELRLLDQISGETVQTLTIDRPEKIHNIRCLSDATSHVVAITEDVEQPLQQGGQPISDFRNPPLNGTLLAIDRFSREKLWQRPVRNVRLTLEQPGSLPVLLMSFLETRQVGDVPQTQSVLYVIDRRTGEDILYRKWSRSDVYFSIDPNLPQNRVDFLFPQGSVRLTYGAIGNQESSRNIENDANADRDSRLRK